MVRSYTPKSNRFNWSAEQLELAVKAVESGMSVPRTTFQRKLAGVVNSGQRGTIKHVITTHQEAMFAEHLITLQTLIYDLSTFCVRKLIIEYAERNSISHTFSGEKRTAGKDWMPGFLKRNPQLTIMAPEK